MPLSGDACEKCWSTKPLRVVLNEGESFNSKESKYDYTNNLVAFLASISLDCNISKDIKSNDNSKCKFDNLKVSYNVLLEESLKTKAENLKVNNKALKINVINDSLKSEKCRSS